MPKANPVGEPASRFGAGHAARGKRKGGFSSARTARAAAGRSRVPFLGNIVTIWCSTRATARRCSAGARRPPRATVFRSTDFGRTWKEAERPPGSRSRAGEKGLAVEHVFWLTPGTLQSPAPGTRAYHRRDCSAR